jgi:ABC-type Fe3+-siderophore transport system permease subunit
MAMSMKEKILLVWLLVVVAFGFVFRHFWASTVYALGRAVAMNLGSLPGLAKFAAVICSVHLLP